MEDVTGSGPLVIQTSGRSRIHPKFSGLRVKTTISQGDTLPAPVEDPSPASRQFQKATTAPPEIENRQPNHELAKQRPSDEHGIRLPQRKKAYRFLPSNEQPAGQTNEVTGTQSKPCPWRAIDTTNHI